MSATTDTTVITPDQLLRHWQAHRRLTRKVIEAFPDDALFTHEIGGMRTFGTLAMEMVTMAVPIVRGVSTGQWSPYEPAVPTTKAGLLELWDKDTADIDTMWPAIPPHRFQEVDTAFGQWTMPGYEMILYAVDNEIHHRGQGYVYLRSLGVTPPQFYDR